MKEARIVSLSSADDDANRALHEGLLPDGATLVGIVESTVKDIDVPKLQALQPNVIFVSHAMARQPLADLLRALPSVEWIHARSAGIDFIASNALSAFGGAVTNARGTFSSTLAEYTLLACSYFAKDVRRLLQQQDQKQWNKFSVLELRKATLGIVGFGDIGKACATLAKRGYGMRVVALKRTRHKDDDTTHTGTAPPLADEMYFGSTTDNLNAIFAQSDYILCSAPLTKETRGMIGREQFEHAKQDAVFINVGRGPIVDQAALVEALSKPKDGQRRLKGAALDVFEEEPLPEDDPLWTLPNVLLSPHNMDQTATFMHEATEFFVETNLPLFMAGEELLNPVNPAAGY